MMAYFLAGVGVRDITPPPGCPMWGYSDRSGPATGTLDPLYAKTIAFQAGENIAALVTLDLGRPLNDVALDRIRERARAADVDYVFFTASHTHHAPVLEMPDAPYMPAIENGVAESIEEAASKLQPARMGIGTVEVDIAHNRRVIGPDGRCNMLWRNAEKKPTSPVDKQATVIRVTTLDGAPVATLVHYACHPVVMGPSNLEYSADYVGEMKRLVKNKTGAECLFLQGGCGNINPYLDKTPIRKGGADAMRSVGKEFAEAVLAALPGIDTAAVDEPAVEFAQTNVPIGTRWDLRIPENAAYFRDQYGPLFDLYAPKLTPDMAVPASVLVLNGELALLGMPGEIFVQYQLALKKNSLVKRSLLCGYTNGFYLYFPTIYDAAAGGYGGLEATMVGLGAADKLLAEGQAHIGRLAGRFHELCSEEHFVEYDDEKAAEEGRL